MQISEPKPIDQLATFTAGKHRLQILRRIEKGLATPMAVLGFIWLGLVVSELGWGLSRFGDKMTTLIWAIFLLDFLLRLAIAPRRLHYLRRNWLTAIALVLPALRIVRFARLFRTLARLRGLRLVRILASVNRGLRALGNTMQRRGLGYVLALTAIVTVAGAAGMLSLEKDMPQGAGLSDYWEALWWTAMIITTMGSDYWPRTPEGRALCLFLSVYAFSVFGYVTGAIATYFIDRDATDDHAEVAGQAGIEALRNEIVALRDEIRGMKNTP